MLLRFTCKICFILRLNIHEIVFSLASCKCCILVLVNSSVLLIPSSFIFLKDFIACIISNEADSTISRLFINQNCFYTLTGTWKCPMRLFSSASRTKYSRMDQVKFVEDSLWKFEMVWSALGCLPQILFSRFLNAVTHMYLYSLKRI